MRCEINCLARVVVTNKSYIDSCNFRAVKFVFINRKTFAEDLVAILCHPSAVLFVISREISFD